MNQRLLCLSVVCLCLMTVANLAAGRVDLSFSAEITLPEKQQTKVAYAGWVPEPKKTITCDLPKIAEGEWGKAVIRFSVPKPGGANLMLMGPYVAGGKDTRNQLVRFYYDNVKLNGKLIANGDFESGENNIRYVSYEPKYPAVIVSSPAGGKAVAAWHDGQAHMGVMLQAGENVLEFDYRLANDLTATPANAYSPLSLGTVANMGYCDTTPGDGKGGWTDQGPLNDLQSFNPAQKKFADIPFAIVEPGQNNGKSCVVFAGKNSSYGVKTIQLPVNKECNTIYLLNACAWANPKKTAGTVKAVYQDDSVAELALTVGDNTGDWWSPAALPNAEIGWKGSGAKSGECGLYLTKWQLPKAGMVKYLEVSTSDNEVVLILVGATAAMVYNSAESVKYTVKIDGAQKYTAIPLEYLRLEMRKKGVATAGLDSAKTLAKLQLINPAGQPVPLVLARYTRNFSPVLLAQTDQVSGNYELRCGGGNTEILPPRAAFQKLTRLDRADYRQTFATAGKIIAASQFTVSGDSMAAVPDMDSFYNQALRLNDTKGALEIELDLAADGEYAFYVFSRAPENFVNAFFLYVNGSKDYIKVGGNFCMPETFYWSGGQRLALKKGKNTFKLVRAAAREAELDLALFYLTPDHLTPVPATFADELRSLVKAGFTVYGFADTAMAEGAPQEYQRFVNQIKSFPDFTPALRGSDIDRRGFLHADGKYFRFADGTTLSSIWGCNVEDLYDICRRDRMGDAALDVTLNRLRSMGYEMVRHMIITLPPEPWTNQNHHIFYKLGNSPLTFAPEFWQEMQMLIAACHRNGMYLNITLWNDNMFFSDLGAGRGENAFIGFFHPEAIRRQQQIVKTFFETPNPYRNNICPKDDPTVAIYEIENERTFIWMTGSDPAAYDWRKLKPDVRALLYQKWSDFLSQKYGTVDQLKKSWNRADLTGLRRPDRQGDTFADLEFAPVWDVKLWGNDSSSFAVKFDDTRISAAEYGKNTSSNPVIADGMEFMYAIYRDYLKTMYDYARSLGFKGVITANGADCERFFNQRAAANQVLDATSGGTGYWNRTGYGFLRSLNWLDPLVFTAAAGKPAISREYGPNLIYENAWWGNVITAAVQKSMGRAYLFNFSVGIPRINNPDWFYPDDSFEKTPGHMNLQQESHLFSHFANLASSIVAASPDLAPPEFKLEIGYPLDNVCYGASFRGYNKMTLNNFVPFLYTDSSVRVFDQVYDGNADLVVNEPAMPNGDYRRAKRLFAINPHSLLDRAGKPAVNPALTDGAAAQGFLDQPEELAALYQALQQAGAKLPVSGADFGVIWRDANQKLELNTRLAYFKGDCETWSAFIGDGANAKGHTPRAFTLEEAADAWVFTGISPKNERVLFAVTDGIIDYKLADTPQYMFLSGTKLALKINGKPCLSVLAGAPVNVTFMKNEHGFYVTFMRNRSGNVPAEVQFDRPIAEATARAMDGTVLKKANFSGNTLIHDWSNGEKISYYQVDFSK